MVIFSSRLRKPYNVNNYDYAFRENTLTKHYVDLQPHFLRLFCFILFLNNFYSVLLLLTHSQTKAIAVFEEKKKKKLPWIFDYVTTSSFFTHGLREPWRIISNWVVRHVSEKRQSSCYWLISNFHFPKATKIWRGLETRFIWNASSLDFFQRFSYPPCGHCTLFLLCTSFEDK